MKYRLALIASLTLLGGASLILLSTATFAQSSSVSLPNTVRANQTANPIVDTDVPADSLNLNGVANPMYYGAKGDAVYTTATITTTAGSPTATITATQIPSKYGSSGAYIVIGGAGVNGAQTLTVVSGGTGYTGPANGSGGDVVTILGGTCSTQPTGYVQYVAAGVVGGLVVQNPGACSAIPTGTLSTSGGTGGGDLTVTATWQGASLATTISTVSGSTVTLGTNALTSISGAGAYLAYGHDDSAAIQAAMNSGFGKIIFPANHTFGHISQITLPSNHPFEVDCQSSTIVALGSITGTYPAADSQFWQADSSFGSTEGSSVHNCIFEGMGVVNRNATFAGFYWSVYANRFRDAVSENVLCAGAAYGTGVKCQGGIWNSNRIDNNPNLMTIYPSHAIEVQGSDNHFTDLIISGSWNDAFYMTGGGGEFLTNVHVFSNINGNHFNFSAGESFGVMLYCDGLAPSYACGVINTSTNQIIGMHSQFHSITTPPFFQLNTYANQVGVLITAGHSTNMVQGVNANGTYTAMPSNVIVNLAAASNNFICNNAGATVTSFCGSIYTNNLTAQAASAAFWGSAGLGLPIPATTYTDTSSSGLITREALYAFGPPTLAATSAMTVNFLDTLYLAAPVYGTNVGVGSAANAGLYSLDTAGSIYDNANLVVQGLTAIGNGGVNLDANVWISPTAPTVTSGLGTSPACVNCLTTKAFSISTGSGSPTTTVVLGMPSAHAQWACDVIDKTTNTITGRQTGDTVTSVTFTMSAAPTAGSPGDLLLFRCDAM